VLEPALPVGPPAWVPDSGFDLDYHLRRTRLPEPGSMTQLLRFAQYNALAPLDRGRALWEGLMIEGLAGGRAAYLLKLHHSLTGGMGGMQQLLSLLESQTRDEQVEQPPPGPALGVAPGSMALAVDELTERVRRAPQLARRLWSAGRHAVAHPVETTRGSLRRHWVQPPAPPSPLLANRSGRIWQFGVLECGLAELAAAGSVAGGSVCDAYVAALLGGLRRYHEELGSPVDELPVVMPLSVRLSEGPGDGSRLAGALCAAPVGIADPAERIATIRGTVSPVRVWIPSMAGPAFGRLAGAVDLSASKVPDQAYPVYLAGAKVERVFPFGPLPGVALMAAMVSHVGTCCVGINYDGHAITDHELLMRCLAGGLDEVLALAPVVEGR
jgi:WS/DGAT/MGAT family acyltransferase